MAAAPLPPPADPGDQILLYRRAVDALGGITEHARLLGMSVRHGGRLYAGIEPVTLATLAGTARALLDHARLCHELERRLTPAFRHNLTAQQQQPDRRGRRRGARA